MAVTGGHSQSFPDGTLGQQSPTVFALEARGRAAKWTFSPLSRQRDEANEATQPFGQQVESSFQRKQIFRCADWCLDISIGADATPSFFPETTVICAPRLRPNKGSRSGT